MAIGIILGIVFVGLAVAAGIAAFCAFDNDHPVVGTIAIVALVALIFAFVLVPFSFHTVDTGEVAVVKHLGKVRDVKTAGLYYDFWMTNRYQRYDAKVQNVEISTMAYSSDAQTMEIEMVLQYQIMSDKVINIANQYGSLDLLQNRIESIAIEKSKAVLSAYKAMDIIADRAAVSPAVEQAIKAAIGDEYFVDVTTVVLTNIDFSDAFENAVEEKMIAEQKQLKAEYENQTKVAQAEANARVKILEAEAEAKANELLEKSLTEQILREMYIEKWNGVLPSTVAGEASSIMIPAYGEGR